MVSKEIEIGVEMLENGEHEEEAVLDYLEGLQLKADDLLEDLCFFLDDSKGTTLTIKERKSAIDKRKKSIENQIDKVRSILTVLTMQYGRVVKSGAIQFKTAAHTLSVTKEVDSLFKLDDELFQTLLLAAVTNVSMKASVLANAVDKEVYDITVGEILDNSDLPKPLFDKLRYNITCSGLSLGATANVLHYLQSTAVVEDYKITGVAPSETDIIPVVKAATGRQETTIFDTEPLMVLSESDKIIVNRLFKLDTNYKIGIRS